MGNKVKNIEAIYDYIRVISCVFVIGIHSADNIVYRIGLPMFVFLSGVLILNAREENINEFYFKRFIKIIIPLYLYSLFYVFMWEYNHSLDFFRISNIMNWAGNITNGYIQVHLWYVYMIVGIYLCAPFLKKMCKSLNDNDCRNLLFLLFFISIIKYTFPLFNINIGITNIAFSDWIIMFLLGYLTTKKIINKHYKLIYILGFFSLIFTFFAKKYNFNITNIYDFSITMMLQVMTLFLLFYRNKKMICKNNILNKIIHNISKYTFEIYLIHIFILERLKLYNIEGFLLIILVFIFSYIFAFIVNILITKNIQKLFIIIYNKIKKLMPKHT